MTPGVRGRGWLVSPGFDLGLLLGPPLLAVAVALSLPGGAELPGWGYVAFVLCVDVAHVYASIYRTWLDPAERRRRPRLYYGAPLAAFLGCAALSLASVPLFWTAMAYLAVYHFVRQQVGFVALYRLRQGLPGRSPDAKVEKALVYGLTLWPVLWWHAHLPRRFAWFMPGDFLQGAPQALLLPAGVALAGVAAAHLVSRLRSRIWSPGRDLWVVTTGLVWFGGIVWTDSDFAFTLSNVIAHGLPYLALVAWVTGRQWAVTGAGPASPRWFTPRGAALYLAPLLVLAFVEEGLWDRWVWMDHPWLFGAGDAPPAWLTAAAVPLLATPQVTHYLLDGFIWKLGPQNPGLRPLLDQDAHAEEGAVVAGDVEGREAL